MVAKADDQGIGGLTVYILGWYYAEKSLAYSYDMTVLTAFQRKGIGRELLEFANKYGHGRGFEEVFVQADKVDDYALDFCRTTSPSAEEAVVHFYVRLAQKKSNGIGKRK